MSILLAIQPKWCALIEVGYKTVEIRKSCPKLETLFKVYIYCTKDKEDCGAAQGKVIGEFICSKIEKFHMDDYGDYEISDDDLIYSCLSRGGLKEYGNGAPLYMWRISNLVIYDKPKELADFGKSKPPQSWYYVNKEGSLK